MRFSQGSMCAVAAALLSGVGASSALGAVTFSGSGAGFGSNTLKEASVTFDLSGTDLIVTLTNTATSDVLVPADVLTAVLFDITVPMPDLTAQSAVLNAGSSVILDPDGQPAGGVVGGEWAYVDFIVGAPGNRQYGLSSTGIDLFGPGDRFPGPDLSPPASPDGVQYGLVGAGDNPATGNGGILGSGGLIKNSVVFTLSGLPANFDLSRIHNVLFFYGTSVGEGDFPGGYVPAPGSVALLGLSGACAARRRRR